MTTVYAIITARGGSKGIPKKNLAALDGKPLIAWTIEVALQCKSVQRVIVSTNDAEIATVSRQWGAEVPFMRPNSLAKDTSAHIPVMLHTIEWLKTHDNAEPEFICLLQPTSPFRSQEDINGALKLLQEKNGNAVVSVCDTPVHPYLTKQLGEDGSLHDFLPTPHGYLARQSLPPVYALNGAIYLIRTSVLERKKTFFPNKTFAWIMPPERSIDIDTPWDLYMANLLAQDQRLRQVVGLPQSLETNHEKFKVSL